MYYNKKYNYNYWCHLTEQFNNYYWIILYMQSSLIFIHNSQKIYATKFHFPNTLKLKQFMASRSQMPMIKWKLGMCLTKALISSSNILFRLSSLLLFCVKSAFFLSSFLLLSLFSFSSFSNSANCKQHFHTTCVKLADETEPLGKP